MDNLTLRKYLIFINGGQLFLSLSNLMSKTAASRFSSALLSTCLAVQSQTDHITSLGLSYFTCVKGCGWGMGLDNP